MKAVSVCGYHHTGKTTVCEILIKAFSNRGYKVTSIKNIHYEDFKLEKPDSNSDRHYKAGAEPVFARGINETGLIWQRQLEINEMLPHIQADWLVIEGMSKLAMPRIICGKTESDIADFIDPTVLAVSGLYADEHQNYQNLPVISAINTPDTLTELVIDKSFDILPQIDPKCCMHCGMTCHEFVGAVLRGEMSRSECVAEKLNKVRIWIDDHEIKLVPFVQNIVHDSIEALLKNLKGYEKGKVRIEYDNCKD